MAKSGGLADVCGALPTTLAALGIDVRVMLPAYPQAVEMAVGRRVVPDSGGLCGDEESRLITGNFPDSGVPVILFDSPAYFRRNGLYQDSGGNDWPDNHLRFGALCRAAMRVCLGTAGLDWCPEVVHAHDWHTGLLPALLRFSKEPTPKIVFTIHNLAFQGNFPLETLTELGLPDEALSPEGAEFYGRGSFMKAGIRYSDRLTTVSPNYAREILTAEHGCGLDGVLRARQGDLVGILNGVDYNVWDPANDSELPHRYSVDDLRGKSGCKAALQRELGLPSDNGAPLMIYVNRLTHQKMADVLLDAIPRIVANGAQLVVHGEGERDIQNGFSEMARRHPDHLAVRIGYAEPLAHRMNAGADISLTPSRFEPCGLTTMYGMRYGALPVTRPVGGLADTVDDAGHHGDGHHEHERDGTGFVFDAADAPGMASCVERATRWYDEAGAWDQLQRRAMGRDFGWERSACRYIGLYRELLGEPLAAISEFSVPDGREDEDLVEERLCVNAE